MPQSFLAGRGRLREAACVAGGFGILAPCVVYTATTPFPGPAALAPCVGTGLIIWANIRATDPMPPTVVGQMLASKPFIFFGSISYSLYLWHWPVFAFYTYERPDADAPIERIALVLFAVLLGLVSWRFVETPFRRKSVCGAN